MKIQSTTSTVPRRAFMLGSLIPLLAACTPEHSADVVPSTAGGGEYYSKRPSTGVSVSGTASSRSTSVNPIKTPHAWQGPQTGLSGEGKYIAWTVDDGKSPKVVRAYAEFAARTGTRLTFFINGSYNSFEQNLDVLLPLVKSGQLQIGNHTWSHAALTELEDDRIVGELTKNDEEIMRLFGVSAKPYFRPPYGYYNQRVLDIAAGAGYNRAAMWYGSLADSSPIPADEIYKFATEYARAQHILIGHLNYEGIIAVLDKIKALLDERGLTTVTLRDYYG